MTERKKARAVGFNHVALEVGDIDEALEFYGNFLDFELRGKSDGMAFIDLGDQFLALQKGRRQSKDEGRHFGLVVSDKEEAWVIETLKSFATDPRCGADQATVTLPLAFAEGVEDAADSVNFQVQQFVRYVCSEEPINREFVRLIGK